jgi:hypothetical protein
MLNNVRQTLRMAALTAVIASAPLSLSNAIASADFERVTPNAPVELAGRSRGSERCTSGRRCAGSGRAAGPGPGCAART